MLEFIKKLFGFGARSADRRTTDRVQTNDLGVVVVNGKVRVDCRVIDISTGGARLELLANAWLPNQFEVRTDRYKKSGTRVWYQGNLLGMKWDEPSTFEALNHPGTG